MDLFNVDTLQNLCHTYGLRPSRSYGQNYLIDPEVIDDIIRAAQVSANDEIVEVGPGFGTLTLALASHVKKIRAFEIEKKLEPYWENLKQPYPNVLIEWGNVLKQFSSSALPPRGYKVVANLPYQITSPVIRLFLETDNPPAEMILMVQKEVAERICAKPGDMSVLAVAVQYYAEAELVRVVPRASFWPSPAVDSAVIRLTYKPKQAAPQAEAAFMFHSVKIGFANRRKLLIKNLESVVGKKNRVALADIFNQLGLLPTVRAQELSVDTWKNLSREIALLSQPIKHN